MTVPRIVFLRDSFTLLQWPEAVEELSRHGLTPKQTLEAGDEPHVVGVVVGLGKFGLADAAPFPNLETVARFGAGADNIASDDLWGQRRISSSCTIDLGTRDVAEFALGMIIAALRGVPRDLAGLRATPSRWRVIDRTPALRDAVVGIAGAGHIGLETVRLVAPLTSRVLLWNRTRRDFDLRGVPDDRVEFVSDIMEFARHADVISLHVALGDETLNLIGKKFFETVRASRRSIAIVNTSRGEVVDEAELLAALNDGTVRDAVLDVWSAEGARSTPVVDALRAHPRVLPTSHIGSHTESVLERYSMQCVRNVIALVENRPGDVARYVVRG